jgi:hypothetical protein
VPWDDGPFGHRTWVSDHSRITLSEIARGAPLPTRAQAARLTSDVEGWHIVDRVGVAGCGAAMPHEIANATLNRFGPDTRAAVLLTAVNRLLDPVRHAVCSALDVLVASDGEPLPMDLRMVGWTVLMIETFRSQPALVSAGIAARAIQRQLVSTWELPLSARLAGMPLTRCEISAPARAVSPSQPDELDVVDATFPALRDNAGSGSVLAKRLHRDEIVDRLLRQLHAAGSLQDASHLWLSERRDDELVVEALMPPTQLTRDFVEQVTVSAAGQDDHRLPRVPSNDTFAALPALARRAVLIAILGMLRHVQIDPQRRERTRQPVVHALAEVAELAKHGLPENDPMRPLVRCRTALMAVQTQRYVRCHDIAAPMAQLLAGANDCAAALRSGLLDRGAAAEIIGAANIEVNIVRQTNATGHDSGLPDPAHLDVWLRRSWRTYLDAIEVNPDVLDSPDAGQLGLVGYHLHNYAAFLTWQTSAEDLHAAVRLFREVVIPAREAFLAKSGVFEPLRHSLQVASRATSRLAEATAAAGDRDAGRAWASLGIEWIHRALADDSTTQLLGGLTEPACRLALLVARALVVALELDVAPPDDLDTATNLVELARRWEESSVGADPDSHVRHSEVVELDGRIQKLRGSPSLG